MCKFHGELNVHKPRAVFSLSPLWKTARQEFMMSRSWVEVSVTVAVDHLLAELPTTCGD